MQRGTAGHADVEKVRQVLSIHKEKYHISIALIRCLPSKGILAPDEHQCNNYAITSIDLHITHNLKSRPFAVPTQKWPPTLALASFVLMYIHLPAAVTVAIYISNDLASLNLAVKKLQHMQKISKSWTYVYTYVLMYVCRDTLMGRTGYLLSRATLV